jgi:hypothetical protein
MPAFDLNCARRVFRKIENDAKPVADIADDLKVELFRHGTNSLTLSSQNKAAERSMIA